MSQKKWYVVFRCSNCGFYSLALEGQKTRLCVRCEKTVKIDYLRTRRIEGFEEARTLVNEMNLKVGQQDARSHYSSIEPALMEESLKKNAAGNDRRKGLLRTFQDEVMTRYMKKEVEISELLRECEKLGIPEKYANKLLSELVSGGQAYHPRTGWVKFL